MRVAAAAAILLELENIEVEGALGIPLPQLPLQLMWGNITRASSHHPVVLGESEGLRLVSSWVFLTSSSHLPLWDKHVCVFNCQ